jgi:hypothetical protein
MLQLSITSGFIVLVPRLNDSGDRLSVAGLGLGDRLE